MCVKNKNFSFHSRHFINGRVEVGLIGACDCICWTTSFHYWPSFVDAHNGIIFTDNKTEFLEIGSRFVTLVKWLPYSPVCTLRRQSEGLPDRWTPLGGCGCTALMQVCPVAECQECFCLLSLAKTGNQGNPQWLLSSTVCLWTAKLETSWQCLRYLFTHRPISSMVSPGCSVHTVLELKFGEPVVTLRTTLDYYSCYFSGLVQVYLDPAWGRWRRGQWM